MCSSTLAYYRERCGRVEQQTNCGLPIKVLFLLCLVYCFDMSSDCTLAFIRSLQPCALQRMLGESIVRLERHGAWPCNAQKPARCGFRYSLCPCCALNFPTFFRLTAAVALFLRCTVCVIRCVVYDGNMCMARISNYENLTVLRIVYFKVCIAF
jgi:hypothetical protein